MSLASALVGSAIGIVLIVAGITKLATPSGFALSIADLAPRARRPGLIARIAGVVECLLGVLLMISPESWLVAACGVATTASFVAVQVRLQRMDHSCNCFGSLDDGVPRVFSLFRAMMLVAGTGTLLVFAVNRAGRGSVLAAPPAVVVGTGIGLTFIFSFWLLGRLRVIFMNQRQASSTGGMALRGASR